MVSFSLRHTSLARCCASYPSAHFSRSPQQSWRAVGIDGLVTHPAKRWHYRYCIPLQPWSTYPAHPTLAAAPLDDTERAILNAGRVAGAAAAYDYGGFHEWFKTVDSSKVLLLPQTERNIATAVAQICRS